MEYLLLGRCRGGVGVGVGVDIFRPESESEPESLKIRRLRSPGCRALSFRGPLSFDLEPLLVAWDSIGS